MPSPTGIAVPASFLRLTERTRGAVFVPTDVMDLLGHGMTTYAELARLVDTGWCFRLARGRYATIDPVVRLIPSLDEGLRPFRATCFYPVLQRAVGGIARVYEDRLFGIVLYGSAARGELGPESDLDLIAFVDDLASRTEFAVDEASRAGASAEVLVVEQWERNGHYHLPSVLPATARAFDTPGPIMLDIVADARVLFDPRGRVRAGFDRLRRKFSRSGVRRRRTRQGAPYWEFGTLFRAGAVT